MRRILTIAFILLVVGTYAFAQTDKEILFRDMPWGTSYSDVDRLFPEFGDVYLRKGEEEGSPYDIRTIISTEKSSGFENEISAKATYYENDMKVAGYPINEVEFFFAYPVMDGDVLDTDPDLKCYAARYQMIPSDLVDAEKDLKEKLSSLYGQPDFSDVYTSPYVNITYTIWYGANNTGVALSRREIELFLPSDICINYFTLDGDDWLREASDARLNSLKNEREGDVSGL